MNFIPSAFAQTPGATGSVTDLIMQMAPLAIVLAIVLAIILIRRQRQRRGDSVITANHEIGEKHRFENGKAEWYYADVDKTIGPISVEHIANRIKVAKNQSHLVWIEGMDQWADASSLPPFADVYGSKPPPLPRQAENQTVKKIDWPLQSVSSDASFNKAQPHEGLRPAHSSNKVHPWRRYFARMFDIYVFAIGASFAMGLIFPGLFSGSSKTPAGENQSALGVLYLAAYIPFEAFCLYAFGTTLGKAIYGISLFPKENEITFYQALRRSVLVWWNGLGIGFPIITIFTLISAFNNLKKKGVTSWDAKIGWSVNHSQFGALRWIGILTCWAGVTFVVVVLFQMSMR